jgi:hypothetical protein
MNTTTTETLKYDQFMEMYGDTMMAFMSYYKYTFHFTGKTDDGKTISASYGGSSEDIYRYNVSVIPVPLRQIEPLTATVCDDDYNMIHKLEYQGW